jgi:hypothetical protein
LTRVSWEEIRSIDTGWDGICDWNFIEGGGLVEGIGIEVDVGIGRVFVGKSVIVVGGVVGDSVISLLSTVGVLKVWHDRMDRAKI